MLPELFRDLRLARRTLARVPLVFTTAVLTLAVGIGLATGVFALAYGVLLRPLPYPDADRLVVVRMVRGPGPRGCNIPLREFEEWRHRLRAFDRVAASANAELTLRGAGEPRSVQATLVTDGFFETLGLASREGSTQTIGRGSTSGAFSGRLARQLAGTGWRERGVTIGAGAFSVVAVMPESFTYPAATTDVWIPADTVPGVQVFNAEDQRRYQMVGRLAPGITLEQAQDDVRRVAREIDQALSRPQPRELSLMRLQDVGRDEARATVIFFVIGAALVLLIACANVSGLLFGRIVARRQEFAVRRALGAGVGDVLRTSIAESVVITVCGWAAGLWLAYLVVRAFEALAGQAIPDLAAVRVDTAVLLASLALALAVALLSGGAPALRAMRTDPNRTLKAASDRGGRSGAAIRGTLVVAQIAMTVVLLVAAGLLMRTVAGIMSADRSFEASHALTQRLMLTETTRFNSVDRVPLIDRMVTEVRRLPGVVSAGIGSDLPPNGVQLNMTISLVGENRKVLLPLAYAAVTPGYLEALGVTPVAGRLFEEQDRLATPPMVVVTETAARELFPERDAVGLDLPAAIPRADGTRARPRIIGVVRDVEYSGLDRAAAASIFAVWEALAPGNAHLVVRTSGAPRDIAPAIMRVVQAIDPTLPVFAPRTLDEVLADSIAERRMRLQLAATFAGLALSLAVVAIWGAIAQNVLDRRRELAVRLALGSSHQAAIGLLLRGGFGLTALGLLLGLAAGAAGAQGIRHLLHGVAPWDPISFAAAIGVTALVSAVACYLPARKAAAISPAELLREA
jgi:predicted permease